MSDAKIGVGTIAGGVEVKRGAATTLLLASMFTLLAGAAIAPALPGIMREFGQSSPDAEFRAKLVLSISPLFIAIGGPIAGVIVDRWARKPVLMTSLVLLAASGVAASMMNSITGLLVCRAIMGLAVAGVMTPCVALIGDYFQGEARTKIFGFQGAAFKLGAVVFVLVGGVLAGVSWRAPFLAELLALLIVPLVAITITEPPRSTRPKTGVPVDRLLSGRSGRVLAVVCLIGFVGQVFFYMMPTQVPFLVTKMLGGSPQTVSYILSVSALMSILTASLYFWFRRKFSYQTIFALFFFVIGIGYGLLWQARSYPELILAVTVAGLATGLVLPNMSAWLIDAVPASLRGRATGLMTTSMFIGQFASPLLSQPIIEWRGISAVFAGVSAVAAIGTVAFGLAALSENRVRQQSPA